MTPASIPFDPAKQIAFVGLQQTGDNAFRCKYPVLLVAWLKERGYREVALQEKSEVARLEGDRVVVSVRKKGSIELDGIGREVDKVRKLLQGLVPPVDR